MPKPNPPYILTTQKDVAAVFGVNLRSVRNWTQDGMPGTTGNYDLREIIKWWAQSADRVRHMRGKGIPIAGDGVDWDDRYREMRARLAELDLKLKTGELLPREDVEAGQVKKIQAVKSAFLFLPQKLAPRLFGQEIPDIEREVREEIEDIIRGFAGEREDTQ